MSITHRMTARRASGAARPRRVRVGMALAAAAGLTLGGAALVAPTQSAQAASTQSAQAAPVALTPAADLRAAITYTAGGVPHIRALSYRGAGYGYGWAIAKDNLCQLADDYLTVNGERSRYLGADAAPGDAYSSASTNLSSDLHFASIKASGTVEALVAKAAPLGPRREVRDLVDGYVAGYNKRVAEAGVSTCPSGVPVRPIAAIDVYRTMYALATVAGAGQWIDDLAAAAPPVGAGIAARKTAATATSTVTSDSAAASRLSATLERKLGRIDMGSNGIAVGSAATNDGSSVLLGNPHYPWYGGRRFYQAQLTVPGRMDVSGASLLGFPVIQIGFNANVAWTHTVATPRTFGFRALTLAAGDPTSYVVDGVTRKMTARPITVQVKAADGTVSPVTRTQYSSIYGPIMAGSPDVPLDWTAQTAYALQDANADNLRGLNTWFGYGQSKSVAELRATAAGTQGIPWVNTIATDRAGNAMFADIQVVPGVPDSLVANCGTPLGKAIYGSWRIPILDGSTASCAWTTGAGSVSAGLMSPAQLPVQIRRDYEFNSNDSAWLSNPAQPITGYPLIVGDIGTARTLRTRMAAAAIDERLTGTDGLAGQGFSTASMKQVLFADTSMAARLAKADAVAMCRSFPGGLAPTSTGGTVAVGGACDTLASWDGSFRLSARGAVLFDRFWLRAAGAGGSLWRTPFDATRPLVTPRDLDTANPAVQQAFGDAVAEVTPLGLDASLGALQRVTRAGVTIPIHGGDERVGVLNKVTPGWTPGQGYTDVWAGSSYIQVVGFSGSACPSASTLMTYSQSTDARSANFANQTTLFSQGTFLPSPFCWNDVWRAATSTVTLERPGAANVPPWPLRW